MNSEAEMPINRPLADRSSSFSIVEATSENFEEWLSLALELWPDNSTEEMRETLTKIDQSPNESGFLVISHEGKAISFMNLSLRNDYVPGADQSPVAFVEGIYVREAYRGQGVGTDLIQYAEQWALKQNCIQLASDALLENTGSYAFHTKVGFQEVERVVYFIKTVSDEV